MRQFNLKAVADRANVVEVEGLERASAETFVAAGRVGERHAGDKRNIFAGAAAQHQPAQRPVDDADAAGVARAKDEIGLLCRRQKHGNRLRVMRKITVHLEDEFVIFFQRPFESGDVGAAQAVFFRAVQDVDLRMLRGEFVGDFARAVRRIIVHHQHVHAGRQRQKFLRHAREIFPFIVGRHDDERLVHAGVGGDN